MSPPPTEPALAASFLPAEAVQGKTALRILADLTAEQLRRIEENRLHRYQPYPKQLEFHAAGADYRERMLKAGNQQGKTICAGFEVAMHLTGRYPEWWTGKRWTRKVAGWASGVTGESTRDNAQRILLGRPGAIGTGAIPKECIVEVTMARGIPDAVDSVKVKHSSGGISIVYFKSYEKGREKWQGETLDFIWFDEEPPADIYSEGMTRTNASRGIVLLTYTPLLGMSAVTKRYLTEPNPDRIVISMTIHDARHYSEEDRARIIESYPAHEREARVMGVPMLGSGRIFPIADEMVAWIPQPIPDHWPRLAAIDFGWDHPTAIVWGAWDRDADVVYIYDAYRMSQQTPVIHAAAIRARGLWIPVAWPHDGLQHDKGSGIQMAQQYREQGINMLQEHATFAELGEENETMQTRVSVEAGVLHMLDRMQTSRLKVAAHLLEWFEEFRLYHREDGKIVKEMDDLMSATRYLTMMLRYAKTRPAPVTSNVHRRVNWRTG